MKGLCVALVVVVIAAAGCTSAGYYGQSIRGQLSILVKRRSFESILDDPRADRDLRSKLERVAQMRDFASSELDLPDNGSYRSYVELDREHVVYNVVAAEEFSVDAKTWCFPIVGCVAYRGYFMRVKAARFASRLDEVGFDTTVDGVAAYSTLGWFRDPVLSTFLDRSESSLAALLFHELAHEKVYVKGDSAFNESYATTVELAGLERFLDTDAAQAVLETARIRRKRQADFSALVAACRDRLLPIYADAKLSDDKKRARKADAIAALVAQYRGLRDGEWAGYPGYDAWFEQDLNNAHLASVGTYSTLVPEFQRLLASLDGDLSAFHAAVKELGRLDFEERRRRLDRT